MRTTVAAAALLIACLGVFSDCARAQGTVPPVPIAPTAPGSGQAPPQPALKIVLPAPLAIPPPPPQPIAPAPQPVPGQAPLNLDLLDDRIGIAQQTASQHGLQARILWIDATANIASINSQDKIDALAKQAKDAGFNTIVMDVKPIIGYTLYPSHFAPKLTDWKGALLPADFDPLAGMIAAAHAQGLKLIANMSTFGEGHKLIGAGLAYSPNPDWQTVLYEASRTVTVPIIGAGPISIADTPNQLPTDQSQLAYYSDPSLLKRNLPSSTVDVVDFVGRVVGQFDGRYISDLHISTPPQGAVLVGAGHAGDLLRTQTRIGDILVYNSVPKYVPIAQAQEQKVTMFVNPNNADVQQHELSIVQEIASGYDIDGIIFDDRLRFAAINADFSDLSKTQFEAYVGRKLTWPDDIFKINPYPGQEIIRGPYFEAWTVWRALTIRNWLAKARAVVKTFKPNATVSVYVGSWYGEYYQYGSNWAADDFAGPFQFETPPFQKAGFAGLLDWMTTGCYYTDATINDGQADGQPGASVEAAGQLSNRAANDQAWVYAGLYVQMFDGKPDQFARCIQAATASTQGVMLFDLSQINAFNYWPIITQAFHGQAPAPHTVPGLLDTIREEHLAQKAAGVQLPPVIVYGGVSGTGL